MQLLDLFPEVVPVEQPPKERKIRRKCTRYNRTQNNRRYKLHRKVRSLELEEVKLHVRKRIIELPVMFDLDPYPCLKELIYKFKYEAPTEYRPTNI
ncbi:hypothetical protein [Elizabethkingia anophelis]|uniref:hypothetical protein n=1 Tax=Elizabethkingia anophelis TaxID=1117645 RepID=UPI0013307CB7|nr:hypothetical protein [Elizabethkingia anophelis]